MGGVGMVGSSERRRIVADRRPARKRALVVSRFPGRRSALGCERLQPPGPSMTRRHRLIFCFLAAGAFGLGACDDSTSDDPVNFQSHTKAQFERLVSYCQILDELPEPKIDYPLKEMWFFKLCHQRFQDFVEIPKEDLFDMLKNFHQGGQPLTKMIHVPAVPVASLGPLLPIVKHKMRETNTIADPVAR